MIENFLNIPYISLDKLKLFSRNVFFEIYEVLLVLVSALFIILLFILYKLIRRKFPVKVNCWFCNSFTSVPYEYSNCWDCPFCKQYNGFTKDGDYNKVIKEQFNSNLNKGIYNILKPSFSTVKTESNLQSNGFCKLCNINQQLKIQQLALFVPINEKNYFEEIEQFREKLEKAYKLCSKCENTLQGTLEKQEYEILQTRLNDHQQVVSPKKNEGFKLLQINKILNDVTKKIPVFFYLKCISVVIAGILFLALLYKFETENNLIYLTLPDLIILESFQPYFKIPSRFLQHVCIFGRELSFAGFLCSLLILPEGVDKTNPVNLLIWGLLYILLWSSLTGFQVLLAGVLVFFISRTLKNKKIHLKKKTLPKKYTFRPEKMVYSEGLDFHENNTLKMTPVPQQKESKVLTDFIEGKTCEQPKGKIESSPLSDEKKKKKKKENEVEISSNEQPVKSKASSSSPSLGSSVFSKSFLSPLDTDNNEGESVPLNEVYNNLNDLHLGGKQKKSKPSNFLFANHNFSEKKNNSSIIKPAKFIKNISNSWTVTESNESVSRSSTPSSGYSSQKAEKIDTPNRFEFTKSISPISINPFSRPSSTNCFQYWDGNNGYYNNFNCFSPGFMPFQHFPGSFGHATIYTCSRPPNHPFSCAWPPFSPQKFSPRLSDTSDCENLFQNASKSFESNKKWFKLKMISYCLSICLNVITLVCLVYFISTGMIPVDWHLPKFNFLV